MNDFYDETTRTLTKMVLLELSPDELLPAESYNPRLASRKNSEEFLSAGVHAEFQMLLPIIWCNKHRGHNSTIDNCGRRGGNMQLLHSLGRAVSINEPVVVE